MSTKKLITGCLAFGFVVGAIIAGMALHAANTDIWYAKIMADPKTRAILIDYAQEKTVTAATFKGDKLWRIEEEP